MIAQVDETHQPKPSVRGALMPRLSGRMSKRDVLIRLQRNIAVRLQAAGDLPGALSCIEDMLRIAPSDIDLWQEAWCSIRSSTGWRRQSVAWGAWWRSSRPARDADLARAAMKRLRSSLN